MGSGQKTENQVQNEKTECQPKPTAREYAREVFRVSVRSVVAWVSFMIYLIVLVALVLLWSVASATGTIDNIQQFMKSFGWESFEFKGGQLFVNVMVLGLLGVVLATAVMTMAPATTTRSRSIWSTTTHSPHANGASSPSCSGATASPRWRRRAPSMAMK